MDRERLTPGRIASFACPADKRQAFKWDTEAPRLAVRATRSAKSFIFETKLAGRTVRVKIGSIDDWTVGDARIEARRLKTLTDQGIDPRDERAERNAAREARKAAQEAERKAREERERYTLRKLGEAYTDHLEAAGKAKSAADAKSLFRCHVPDELADVPAREVGARQIAEIVRKVREAGKERTAGKLRSYLFAAYRAAVRAPFDAKLPSSLIPFDIEANPVEPVATIPVKAGSRTLSEGELRTFIEKLGNSAGDRALLVALLAGGQRFQQLLRAKASDFDAKAGTLRLFDPKGKRASPREHVLPLAPRAAGIVCVLADLARERQSDLLFSSYGKRPISPETISKRVTDLSNEMKGDPFQARDLRRTCETMLAGMGISRDVRAQLLSHGIGGVQAKHYDLHSYMNEKRSALAAWEKRIAAIEKGGKAPANVRPIKGKSAAGR